MWRYERSLRESHFRSFTIVNTHFTPYGGIPVFFPELWNAKPYVTFLQPLNFSITKDLWRGSFNWKVQAFCSHVIATLKLSGSPNESPSKTRFIKERGLLNGSRAASWPKFCQTLSPKKGLPLGRLWVWSQPRPWFQKAGRTLIDSPFPWLWPCYRHL